VAEFKKFWQTKWHASKLEKINKKAVYVFNYANGLSINQLIKRV
jgi:hypothetical protein